MPLGGYRGAVFRLAKVHFVELSEKPDRAYRLIMSFDHLPLKRKLFGDKVTKTITCHILLITLSKK